MKVLFDHPSPFALWHGGFQVQIEQTKAALENRGIEVEYLRWWDDAQRGDIIHYFGRPLEAYVQTAQSKGIRVVIGDLLSELAARPRPFQRAQRALMSLSEKVLPPAFTVRLAWNSMRRADACVALTALEGGILTEMFKVDRRKVQVIPNGVELQFLESQAVDRGRWLVCTATVTRRKRVLELAQAAIAAETPLWVIGKPYDDQDPYAKDFLTLAHANRSILRYEGAIKDRQTLAETYRAARGFVLLSTMESLSISALEAAACECPLLLSDLPWARTVFGGDASYCSVPGSVRATAECLKRFYAEAPSRPKASKPLTWFEVADMLKSLYVKLCSIQGTLQEPVSHAAI